MEQWFTFLFILGMTVSCSPQFEPSSQTIIDTGRPELLNLVGTDWNLIDQNGNTPNQSIGMMTLAFSDETITGFSGCNHYTTNYRLYDKTLVIPKSLFTWTLEACRVLGTDAETGELIPIVNLNEQENEFYDQLRNQHQIIVDAQANPPRLTLISENTLLVFEQAIR